MGLIILSGLSTGCLSAKLHTWQTPSPEIDRNAWNWGLLSTNHYCRVVSNHVSEAIGLLQERRFVGIKDGQIGNLAGNFSAPKDVDLKAYLVRGIHFGYFSYAEVRFDPVSGGVLVGHATYDGEMFIPFSRNEQVPTALVVFLPRPPSVVYTTAYLGGDWIFRGRDQHALDTRR